MKNQKAKTEIVVVTQTQKKKKQKISFQKINPWQRFLAAKT